MSPHAALHDLVFLAYVRIVVGVLIGGGGILGAVHFISRKPITSIWQT
jgi:hypothetical protein